MSEDADYVPTIIGQCAGCNFRFSLTTHGLQCPRCNHIGLSSATNDYAQSVVLRYDKVNHLYFKVDPKGGKLIPLDKTTSIPHVLNNAASACRWDCPACGIERDLLRAQAQITVLEELWRLPDGRTKL